MLVCASCGRKIIAAEVKYRITDEGQSKMICPECAKTRGV